MLYHVSRNGQMYGPYTLEELRRYVASGNVLPTDLAKNDVMPEWLPVEQILGTIGAAGAMGYGAPPPGYMRGYAPAYPVAGNYPPGVTELYPDAPNLAWALVALFNVLTCGLFMIVWNIVMSAWMRRVYPASQALFYYIGGAVLTLSSSGSFLTTHHHHGFHHHPLAALIALAGWVIRLIARYSMKADMELHFNGPEPYGLQMNPVVIFFFGGLYIQSQLSRMNEIKNAIRLQSRFQGTAR